MDESQVSTLATAVLIACAAFVWRYLTNALTSRDTKIKIAIGVNPSPGMWLVMAIHAVMWLTVLWLLASIVWFYV